MDNNMTTGEYMSSLLTVDLRRALQGVVAWAETSSGANATAARIYALHAPQAMMEAVDMGRDPKDGLSMQINYVLANLQYWRGEEARHVKKVLKEHTRQG